MYYWSRWTSIPTTDEAQEMQSSWRDTAPRLAAQRETRPVVVVARNRTQPLSTSSAYQRERLRERATTSGISLDVRRSTYAFSSATRSQTPASWQHDATTQPVVEAFKIK
jgi:hypothetical protein